jgi:integrase
MRNQGDRAGRFFLKRRVANGIWYICWYNPSTGQADRFSTGTTDRETARAALYEHALKHDRPAPASDAQLAHVMQTCWVNYGRHLPSAHTHLAAQRDALEIWGDVSIRELDRKTQLEFVRAMRERGLADWTISTRLRRIWAMMNWYRRDNPQLLVPDAITASDWKPVLLDKDRIYSLEELASLFNAASDQTEDLRYTREHWWRFMVLAVGTASREAALRELTWQQVDLRLGRIRLNPDGRRQTKKRRPTVPIAPTLARELASWTRDGANVMTYYGRPLATREFYDLLAEKASVTGGPNIIRHTVRTWLAEGGVPDAEADVFMGHKAEGSATGKRYIHRRPEYLRSVTDGIESLYAALAVLVKRPFKGRDLVDQPQPDFANEGSALANYLPSSDTRFCNFLNLERETRLELATPTLARSCSTN